MKSRRTTNVTKLLRITLKKNKVVHIQAYFEDSEKNLRNDGVSHATQVFKEETNRESGKEAALEK